MANFSTSQVRQLYVAEKLETTINSSTATKGIKVGKVENQVFFEYAGVDGPIRSDLIDISKITYAKAIKFDSLQRPLKEVKVTLNPTVNSGNPVAGQIYVLGINILEFGSLSPEDTYYKNVAVEVRTGMTTAQVYTALKDALELSFKRESIKYFDFSATATELVIKELEQPWRLGVKSSEAIMFNVVTGPVSDADGFEVNWGEVSEVTSTTFIHNGKQTADLEYFCMGERGDIYRQVGFPDTIDTTYLVDHKTPYNYIELQFHYNGTGNAIQESQKHLTIVVPAISGAEITETNKIVAAINTAVGSTILTPLT